MSSVPAISYREDILESLKDRFVTRLDRSLEEGREPEVPDSAVADLRSQYQVPPPPQRSFLWFV
jgi:hypothetical protein